MLNIDTEREDDGRWIAEIASLPGVLAYGQTREEAVARTQSLALRVFADRLEHGEAVPDLRRIFAMALGCLLFASIALFQLASAVAADAPTRPNIVLLFTDDQGYGDVGCFGATEFKTPNLDRMAAEGTRFTSFYVAQPVCTASRAALMTGCYSNRVSLFGALNHESNVGIAESELLLPEMCKAAGYATAIFGKWHLGHRDQFLPTRHGFDEFLGLPYSNDNGPLHPIVRTIPSSPLIHV